MHDYNGEDDTEDIAIVNENAENEVIECVKIRDPEVGMEFDTVEEFFQYYQKYGNEKGFPVKRRSSGKNDDGEVNFIVVACSHSGKAESKSKNVFKRRPVIKTDCKAKVRIVLCSDEKWRVSSVNLDHNHKVSPGKSRYYKSNRIIRPYVKRRLEMNDKTGIRPNKNFNSFIVEAGGHENVPFLEKDCYNFIGKVRRLRLGDGDAMAIQNYFLKMQANNANFFYLMNLDGEGRLKNVFWADARSRAAYEEFGDAITFDTTYLTNKYDMPFAPFVGVNHHGHSTLLGCGLISNEDAKTFTWLFKAWLACMNGRAPAAIITDQDKAMKNAIEDVFPDTRHRWCLWHIMKKLPEKLRSCSQYESIKYAMQHAVYDSLTPVEFDGRWDNFIEKFQLQKNDWLSGLYNERHRWVPAFVKNTFWAGMSTTQRSESMHAFFDGYVNSKTTLKQFVEQYENALRSKVQKEDQDDFNSFNSFIPCITRYAMEKQFQDAYSTAKFKEFQKELTGKLYCEVSHITMECGCFVYDISEDMIGEMNRQANFTVWFKEDDCDIKCNCQLFEFRGILCRHAITVLINRKVHLVPEKYMLRRWRKDVKRCHTKVKIVYSDWAFHPENERFDRMCNAFNEVADLATDNEDKTKLVMHWTKWLVNELKKGDGACESNEPNLVEVVNQFERTSPSGTINPTTKESCNIRSPVVVRSKGRPPFKRKQSQVEQFVRKKKEKKKKNTQENEKASNLGMASQGQAGNAEQSYLGQIQVPQHEYVVQDYMAHGSQHPFLHNYMAHGSQHHSLPINFNANELQSPGFNHNGLGLFPHISNPFWSAGFDLNNCPNIIPNTFTGHDPQNNEAK